MSLSYREIPLTKGLVALVDADLYPILSQYLWRTQGGYAARYDGGGRDNQRSVFMHHEVVRLRGVDIPPCHEVHHKNGAKADNRSDNLAVLSLSHHKHTRPKLSTNTSGFKGVCYHKPSGKWHANVGWDGKNHYLGSYTTPEEAAAACAVARVEHGLLLPDSIDAPVSVDSDLRACPDPRASRIKSGYRGVSWHRGAQKWVAWITARGKGQYLGLYANPEDAARACEVARRHMDI